MTLGAMGAFLLVLIAVLRLEIFGFTLWNPYWTASNAAFQDGKNLLRGILCPRSLRREQKKSGVNSIASPYPLRKAT